MTDDKLRAELAAMLAEPHHLGFPVSGKTGTYDGSAVIVKREWHERLRALAASAPDEGRMVHYGTSTPHGPEPHIEDHAGDRPAVPVALDVERLARAQHASYDRDPMMRRIEWTDLSDAEKGMWRRHARVVAREYAALSPEPTE